ncbi:UNVERIFIED_CONTAM: hypothetical protein FKN15_017341 [Acipenser sinensis]
METHIFYSVPKFALVSYIGYEPNKTDIILTKDIVGTLKQGSNVVLRKKGKEKETFPMKIMKLGDANKLAKSKVELERQQIKNYIQKKRKMKL